jgi:hypothetical protein
MFSFIETRLFTKLVLDYLSDEDYAALQAALMQHPDSGPVIPGSGGVRKLRWAAPGPRQAWGLPRHLLRATSPRRYLDVDDVSEERCRKYSRTRAPTDS